MNHEELAECQKRVTELRDALRIKGEMEQTEKRAKFLHDDTLTEAEEYKEAKEEFDGLDKDVKKRVENIRHDVRFGRNHAEEGFEIDDDDYDERDVENVERRGGGGGRLAGMTELRPTGNRGGRGGRGRDNREGRDSRDFGSGNRGGGGNRGNRGGRRGGKDFYDREDRYTGNQSYTDYMGREVNRGGNRRGERDEEPKQQRPRGNRGGRGGRDLEMDEPQGGGGSKGGRQQAKQPRVRMEDNPDDFPASRYGERD